MSEITHKVWTEEHVLAAERLHPPGPFVQGRAAKELDETAAVLGAEYSSSDAVRAARERFTGEPFTPVLPLHVLSGFSQYVDLFGGIALTSWPEGLYLPGNSQELWLGLRPCPPDHRYASSSTAGASVNSADPATGQVFSWAQVPASVSTGVSTAGVFAFVRPTKSLSVLRLAPEVDWTYTDRYFTDWQWSRDYSISVRLGGDLVLSAFVWNPATNAWEVATNGLGGTPVLATRSCGTLTMSNSAESPPTQHQGHVESGQFTVPVLVEAGRLYAVGVHVRSWWAASVLNGHSGGPAPDPLTSSFKVWTWMKADIPRIWA